MATNREIHITSDGIASTRRRVERELKDEMIGFVRSLVPLTALGGLGFGVIGNQIIGSTYEGIMEQADGLLGDAQGALDGWDGALAICQRNWRAAEDHNIVQYRA
ncbi:hypothetical protein ACFLIM_09495 [Nonomuraea sp. M3C6]|uniref:Excreted virulence factor EspC, type VII ESX diderm n=1 Tax=Nonomuraea marmarensis TaxID=3351344 RepID=A0ABW7AAS3_9ACTN